MPSRRLQTYGSATANGKALKLRQVRHTVEMPYHDHGTEPGAALLSGNAINKTIEAIAKGRNASCWSWHRTGKTYTAFQIIWRLWKSSTKKRILFLADRNILVDQTMTNDFKPFGLAMTKIRNGRSTKSMKFIYRCIRRSPAHEEDKNIYKQFCPISSI